MIQQYTREMHAHRSLIQPQLLETSSQIIGVTQTLQESAQAAGEQSKKLIVQMEAIHVGRTANYTYYTKEGLSSGLSTWTHPYLKPVLTHHNDQSGEPIGRITRAEFSDLTPSGRAGLIFTAEISDSNAVQKVLDGRYQTVSIGATTDKVICNICGTDRVKEWCDHFPGETYESQTAHFIIGTTIGREVSYVNTPADEFAGNISVSVVEHQQNELPNVQFAESISETATERGMNAVEKKHQEHASEHVQKLANEHVQEHVSEHVKEEQSHAINEETSDDIATQVAHENVQSAIVHESSDSFTLAALKTLIEAAEVKSAHYLRELQEQKDINHQLLIENTEMRTILHAQLAEQVVTLKKALHKPDVMGKSHDEMMQSHVSRSNESLQDSLSDLLAEQSSARPERVDHPNFLVNENQEQNRTSVKDAISILSGMFSAKRS